MNNRHPVTIPVQPWFKDHNFGGKIVFAAVETMILLAAQSLQKYPKINISNMEDGVFAKFLEIPQQQKSLNVLVECDVQSDGRLQSKLLSQMQIGKMRRMKVHGQICFTTASAPPPSIPAIDNAPPPSSTHQISSEHVYHELVPFGLHYHTLQGELSLWESGAWSKLKAPNLPFTDPVQQILGSPFPLDGAMHAACVLGQQLVDYAPFPVGFKRRIIFSPTQPGTEYITRIIPVSQTADEQLFDLGIFTVNGEICETVTGLRMRDVTKAVR